MQVERNLRNMEYYGHSVEWLYGHRVRKGSLVKQVKTSLLNTPVGKIYVVTNVSKYGICSLVNPSTGQKVKLTINYLEVLCK